MNDACCLQVAALRTTYGENPTATLPASIQAGQRATAGTAAPPPPGSLLASPILLESTTPATWRARFRAAVAALLATPADLAGNPQGPEVLHAYGDTLDQSKVWVSTSKETNLLPCFLSYPNQRLFS